MPLKLRDQFNITIYFMCIHIYIAIYINFSTINFWFMEYTYTLKISKYNTKDSHQIKSYESKRKRNKKEPGNN